MSKLEWRETKKGGVWRKNYDGLFVVVFKRKDGRFGHVCDGIFSKESWEDLESAKLDAEVLWCPDDIEEHCGSRIIYCDVSEIELEGDYGPVDSVMVTCSKCGHETESFGTGQRSIDRCLVLLSEECPLDERNFYTEV